MTVRIIRSDRKSISIRVTPAGVTVRAPYMATDREIRKLLKEKEEWIDTTYLKVRKAAEAQSAESPLSPEELRSLADEALKVIPGRVAEIARCMGVDYGRITIRCQKTRWGSCSAQKNLNFNCLLMLAPVEVLDAVIVHELCHLKYLNHSRDFYRLVHEVCPDYDRQAEWLKENGSGLLARAER